jgi:hypothetical protein
MDDPVKIIYKYKNKNRRIQYNIYIFLGSLVEDNIKKILNKIKDKNLYDSLTLLDNKEIKKLNDRYGEYWYKYFFNSHFIDKSINNILKSKDKTDNLKRIYGNEWFNKHFKQYKPKVKVMYNFQDTFKRERDDKIRTQKIREMKADLDDVDYTTKNTIIDKYKTTINEVLDKIDLPTDTGPIVDTFDEIKQNGGQIIEGTTKKELDEVATDIMTEYEQEEIDISNEFDIDEIENMYREDVQIDENQNKTSKLLSQVLDEDMSIDAKEDNMIEFDDTKDEYMYDIELSNVYNKNYIYTQFLFKDDTIQKLKYKICASIQNNSNFSKLGDIEHVPIIIPSRQYLWTEYRYREPNKEEVKESKTMLGQKWIKRNELLQIDTVPNENTHIYETLRGNLKLLKDNMRRYGTRIKREDDEHNLIKDYDKYMTNNEIFLIDIYNELGVDYITSNENLKNLYDVYVRIYFFNITIDEFRNIVNYLSITDKTNQKLRKDEITKMENVFKTITNDLIMENEIINVVETIKEEKIKYKKLFKENYIIQSVIHLNLEKQDSEDIEKLDLFRIFDNFILDSKYPFIQYQTPDGQIIFKFDTSSKIITDKQILARWFENAPYGISFKINITDNKFKGEEKYMAIRLDVNGRIEYKTQWREDDKATVNDIWTTYNYVRDLVKKINKENQRLKIKDPEDRMFKFAFISSMQQFDLPKGYIINHNDLSDFARFFYPYIALVIEPRKRLSKMKDTDEKKSKYGTYLRYKRISKYENRNKIERMILYFMKNYEYTKFSLVDVISKQFNITEERAMEEIDLVNKRYPIIKKTRRVLKTLDEVPRYRPPGIDINIQGKKVEKYKMRISGARGEEQLNKIIEFMNILLYLYVETYLLKKKERQILKEKLKKLTNIAKRRHKVEEIVQTSEVVKNVKEMTKLDKERIGFKPEKGQNQWTRACQNSGTDKKRRPQQYTEQSINKLVESGYIYNNETGDYEKKTIIKEDGKRKEIILKAVKLRLSEEDNIYYTCDPKENKEHMYVGFLSRSNNPYGHCMPCCFKKDQKKSDNISKRNYYLKCTNQLEENIETPKKIIGDKLYILQDTHKIQEGRFSFLPNIIDIFFNKTLDKINIIKNHYLISSPTGYFFKYGTKQDIYPFLNALGAAVNLTANEIKEKLVNVLEKDKKEEIFTSLNNGDIKTRFETIDNFIDFIKYNEYLDIMLLHDLLSLPGVINKNGINLLVFDKKIRLINNKSNEDFIPLCLNKEDFDVYYDMDRINVILTRENKKFFPVFLVIKDSKSDKNIELIKTFNYKNDKENIVHNIIQYFNLSCSEISFRPDIKKQTHELSAKILYRLLKEKINLKGQIIDHRNKCRFLVANNDVLIPVKPSGSLYDLKIIKSVDKVITDFKTTIKNIDEYNNKVTDELKLIINGVYYNNDVKKNIKKDQYNLISIIINSDAYIPILSVIMEKKSILKITDKYKLTKFSIEDKPVSNLIDKEIEKGSDNIIIDDRILEVNQSDYENESYELFRLEVSNYISKNEKLESKIKKIIENDKIDKKEKRDKIKKILYKISNNELYDMFVKIFNKDIIQKGGEKFIHTFTNDLDLSNYKIKNNRELCETYDKDSCNKLKSNNKNYHCHWTTNGCKLSLNKSLIVKFINKISEEFINKDLKYNELMGKDKYFVSDIVDKDVFTVRKNQKIIKSSRANIDKILTEMFGKDKIPTIGRRKISKTITTIDENILNPVETVGNLYIQKIISNNNTIFRAYSNSYHWIKNELYDEEYRNIGFYSDLQTKLTNYFKSVVIKWLLDDENKEIIEKKLKKYIKYRGEKNIEKYTIKLSQSMNSPSYYIVELFVMSKIYNYPILIYDIYNKIDSIFDNGNIYINANDNIIKNYENKKKNSINIKFDIVGFKSSPNEVFALYWK